MNTMSAIRHIIPTKCTIPSFSGSEHVSLRIASNDKEYQPPAVQCRERQQVQHTEVRGQQNTEMFNILSITTHEPCRLSLLSSYSVADRHLRCRPDLTDPARPA